MESTPCNSSLGSSILSFLQTKTPSPTYYKLKLGKAISKHLKFKISGISSDLEEASEKLENSSMNSDDSDMAIDSNPQKKEKNRVELKNEGTRLILDKEVLEIMRERKKIKSIEVEQAKQKEDEEMSDMYSDLSDNEPLGPGQELNLGNKDIKELAGAQAYNDKIEDLVKTIEAKREQEITEKKQRDIKQATVEDYFTGFSSTITKKVDNPKKIRSVMEEVIKKGTSMTREEEEAEIQRRFNANQDDYMECFPMEQDNIKGFDETNFAAKVKEKYEDADLIKKDEEWMKTERKFAKDSIGQKWSDGDMKKREAKDLRKADQQAKEVMEYMENN